MKEAAPGETSEAAATVVAAAAEVARARPIRTIGRPRARPVAAARPPWRKILWEKQDYEDNHVDEKFMEDLSKNENVKFHSFAFLAGNSVVSVTIKLALAHSSSLLCMKRL